MTAGRGGYRESELPDVPPRRGGAAVEGRRCISVIGIDRYRRWHGLNNAVSDARGVLAAFEDLGFGSVGSPLLDDAATSDAIRRLPGELAAQLDEDDSLVVFFAGHGHTTTARFPDGLAVSKGYLIPVDAELADPRGRDHSWQRLEPWLTSIAELPPRHILVILDSCHSGIALSRGVQHRGIGVRADGSQVPFRERRSRRVVTSALDNQRAMDAGGPLAGHSVFTGCLIEALHGSTRWPDESPAVSVSEIAAFVGRRVGEYSNHEQVPGMGWLEYDSCGELLLPIRQARAVAPPQRPEPGAARGERSRPPRPGSGGMHGERARSGSGAMHGERPPRAGRQRRPSIDSRSPSPEPERSCVVATPPLGEAARLPGHTEGPMRDASARLPDRTEGWALDPALAAALDRHHEERRRGAHVLTVVAGDAMAAHTSWGTWAARHGYLTLATQSVGLDAAVADLLAQTPWLRCVPEARKRLAAAARIDVQEVDAALDARSRSERGVWIDDVAARDPHVRVSGWLLSSLRCAAARVPDPTTAPVGHGELLAIACDLASPTAVLMFHPTPDERWLERAIVTAAELTGYLPAHSVAVTSPGELVTRVLGDRRSGAAWTMARQGLVSVDAVSSRLPGRARHSTMRVLHDALSRDPRTRGRFELDGKVATADGPEPEPEIDVALVAHGARIAVELDAWYHFHDPEGYRRDRVQDTRLQRAGYFVLRFLAEDVGKNLDMVLDTIQQTLFSRQKEQ